VPGAYRTDRTPEKALVGFAIGRHHGDHVEYHTAASARLQDLGRLSLGYAPVWDLILWAKRSGAKWFDLGGITEARDGKIDPLAGVSDFKHRFSRIDTDIRTEMALYPPGFRPMLARSVSRATRYIRTRKIGP